METNARWKFPTVPFGGTQRAGVTKDEYLADEHLGAMGGRIDDTAQFKSKFKPTKGEITEKYNPNDSLVVPGVMKCSYMNSAQT